MQCGEMKHRIDIVVTNEQVGPFGDTEKVILHNLWSKKEELVGTQLYQSMGESDKTPCNFIIRRNDKITNKMFVLCEEHKYDIKSSVPLKANDSYTILTCYEIE